MGFFGKLFGTEAALNSVVKSVSSGLDALVYTDEERAGDAAADRSEGRKMVVDWLRNTQGQNLARRLIALSVTGTWLGAKVLAMFLSICAIYSDDPAKLLEVVAEVKGLAADMTGAVMLILAFYFAAPHMGGIARAVTNRFIGNVNEK